MNDEEKTVDANLPVTQQDGFVADFHEGEMDMAPLKGKTFVVAVNAGDRNGCKLLASTMRGPYDYYEMLEQVGTMHERECHHAKVTVLTRDHTEPVKFLDKGTVDYIEAHWQNIIAEELLESALGNYTIEAGLLTEQELEKTDENQ